MPTVDFTTSDGVHRSVEAIEGETLMKAAVRSGVPGIEGECGGEMNCGTCHVYIHEPWKSRLRSASDDERDLLEFDENLTDDSRLGCQVPVVAALDGIEVVVP